MKIELNKMHALTLIEMILAIGVAAMVLIAVNTALFASLRLRDATTNVVDSAAPPLSLRGNRIAWYWWDRDRPSLVATRQPSSGTAALRCC